MKRIVLRRAESTVYDQASQPVLWAADLIDYADLIRIVLRTPLNPVAGANVDEMRRSIRVLDALDGKKAGDVLELEDADWEHLLAKVHHYPYAVDDRRVLEFIEAIESPD